MKENERIIYEKYDNARIRSENRRVWHIKQDNNLNHKTQTILFRLKKFSTSWPGAHNSVNFRPI